MEDAKEAAAYYEEKQRETNRPVNPREPLKRTANNNWIHVTCAVWTPEIKFGNAKALEPSEGIPSIPLVRYDEMCKICKRAEVGACVSCHQCKATCKFSQKCEIIEHVLMQVSPRGMRPPDRARLGIRRSTCQGVPQRSYEYSEHQW